MSTDPELEALVQSHVAQGEGERARADEARSQEQAEAVRRARASELCWLLETYVSPTDEDEHNHFAALLVHVWGDALGLPFYHPLPGPGPDAATPTVIAHKLLSLAAESRTDQIAAVLRAYKDVPDTGRAVVHQLRSLVEWCLQPPVIAPPVSSPIVESRASDDITSGDDELTQRQRGILEAMLAGKIDSYRRRQKCKAIVALVNRTYKPSTYGRAFAGLVSRGLLESEEGPAGGYWLTPKGVSEAHRIASSN